MRRLDEIYLRMAKLAGALADSNPVLQIPRLALPSAEVIAKASKDHRLADTFYDHIRQCIIETQKQLKQDERLVVHFHGGAGEVVLVSDLGYHNPNLIVLYGRDLRGNDCSILAHMESVQLVLRVEKIQRKSQRRSIGFLNDTEAKK